MIFTDPATESVLAALAGALDGVAQIDAVALRSDEGPNALTELIGLANRLGGEIARVAAAVDDAGEWRRSGASSMAAFVSNATGLGWGAARAATELGHAMNECGALDEAVRSGDVTPAAAAAVIPAISDDGFDAIAEELMAEVAGLTPTKTERHVEAWRAVANPVDDEQRRVDAVGRRTIRFRSVGDGMTEINGVVPNRIAQSLRRSLSHLADQQRTDQSERTGEQRRVDALGDLCTAFERGEVTGGRNLPRIIATMTLDDLEQRAGVARGTFGENISSADIDQICCDAVMHRSVADQSGTILNFGRGRRTISPQQFLALVARDGGCRHPGCDRPPQWCEGHHINEFASQGGNTDLDELVLLCHHHHHDLHDRSWSLAGAPTHLIFTGPDGRTLNSRLNEPQRQAA